MWRSTRLEVYFLSLCLGFTLCGPRVPGKQCFRETRSIMHTTLRIRISGHSPIEINLLGDDSTRLHIELDNTV
jgi:hypothetical protein